MTDHVCAWAAASPARYRASSSAKAASRSSGSNPTRAATALVGVDLDDVEHVGVKLLGPLIAARAPDTTERETLPRGSQWRMTSQIVTPRSATVRMFAIATSRPCRTPAFDTRRRSSLKCRRPKSRPCASQSRAAKYASAIGRLTRLAAFSSCGAGWLSSSNLASAASRSASSKNSPRLIRSPSTVMISTISPLGVETLLRGPMRHLSEDRSEIVQPMHGLDVDAELRREIPTGTDVCGQVPGRESDVARRWSMFTQSGVVAGSSRRLSAA